MEKKRPIRFIVLLFVGLLGILSFIFAEANEERSLQISKKELIEDILAKAKNLGPVQYESIESIFMTGLPHEVPPIVATLKVWQNSPYIRWETTTGGVTVTAIAHPDAIYIHSEGKYWKMPSTEMSGYITIYSFNQLLKEIEKGMTLKLLGTEIIDGKLTTVVETTITSGIVPLTKKFWVWNEKGIPLKVGQTGKKEGVVTTIEVKYTNFIFEDIPDSIFEVPEDKIRKFPVLK